MIPRKAIELAIEGGWKSTHIEQDGSGKYWTNEYAVALDPTFWQALGKALGWRTGMTFADEFDGRQLSGWEYHAHRFYDLILTNGDTKKFWQEILANHQ